MFGMLRARSSCVWACARGQAVVHGLVPLWGAFFVLLFGCRSASADRRVLRARLDVPLRSACSAAAVAVHICDGRVPLVGAGSGAACRDHFEHSQFPCFGGRASCVLRGADPLPLYICRRVVWSRLCGRGRCFTCLGVRFVFRSGRGVDEGAPVVVPVAFIACLFV